MPSRTTVLLAGLAAAGACNLATAAQTERTCLIAGGALRLPVLELYTSEGCSSCPPADRWLKSTFSTGGTGAGRVLPLAFHVDYWNRLGWPDRFSNPVFTQRQQEAATRARASAIYTPQFLFDGQDVRPNGFAKEILSRADAAVAKTPRARVGGEIGVGAAGAVRVSGEITVDDAPTRPRARAWAVLYQNDLRSKVTAGENGGRWLEHAFVVRGWAGPFTADAAGRIAVSARWAQPSEFDPARAGVAVFAEDTVTGETLHAASAPLCGG